MFLSFPLWSKNPNKTFSHLKEKEKSTSFKGHRVTAALPPWFVCRWRSLADKFSSTASSPSLAQVSWWMFHLRAMTSRHLQERDAVESMVTSWMSVVWVTWNEIRASEDFELDFKPCALSLSRVLRSVGHKHDVCLRYICAGSEGEGKTKTGAHCRYSHWLTWPHATHVK